MHDRDHYAVMVIDIPGKKVVIFNGLYKDLGKWMDHVISGMRQCMLLGLNDAIHHTANEPHQSDVGKSRHPQVSIHGYTLLLGLGEWRLERGDFVKQVDTFNCGSIACSKILEIYNLTILYEVNLAYLPRKKNELAIFYFYCIVRTTSSQNKKYSCKNIFYKKNNFIQFYLFLL
jgi:hypothetical protein